MRPREIGVSAVSTGAATYECTTVVTADLDALVARVATYEADNRDLTDRVNGLEAERDHYREAMRVQMARVAELEAALAYVADICDAALRHHRRSRGGQSAAYHGPFASIAPSTLRDLDDLVQRARKALERTGA